MEPTATLLCALWAAFVLAYFIWVVPTGSPSPTEAGRYGGGSALPARRALVMIAGIILIGWTVLLL